MVIRWNEALRQDCLRGKLPFKRLSKPESANFGGKSLNWSIFKLACVSKIATSSAPISAGSSAVEQLAFNQLVEGSNPSPRTMLMDDSC